MRYPKLRELKEAIKSLVSRPYTTKFPYKPATPVPEGFRGKPVFDEDVCVGCGACAEVCPTGVIEVTDNKETATRSLEQILDLCIYCGQCERHCITEKGIQLTEEYDMATYDRTTLRGKIEKKLVLCSDCGEIIGPEGQIRWIAERVGESAFTNPTLMLSLLQTKDIPPKSPVPRCADRIRILCHKCRKITTL